MGTARPDLYRRIGLRAAGRDRVRVDVPGDRRPGEKAAVIVTTNLPFSEWSQVIPNPRLCKALIDRLTDQAHIITTGDGLLPVPPHHRAAEGNETMTGRTK